jgi:hypothetical protein
LWKGAPALPQYGGISRHTLAEAQARLPELVARAAAGEEVVIETDSASSVILQFAPSAADMPPLPEDHAEGLEQWLRRVRVGTAVPGAPDAAALVREMRDSGY